MLLKQFTEMVRIVMSHFGCNLLNTSFISALRQFLRLLQTNIDQISIERGVILERGTHEELLAQKGACYELYMSQFDFL